MENKTKAVIFFGNGLNRACGGIDWGGLLEELAGDPVRNQKGFLQATEIPHTLKYEAVYLSHSAGDYDSRISETIGEQQLKEEIKKKVKSAAKDHKIDIEIYDMLANMPVSDYITTNFDNVFDSILQRRNYTPSTYCKETRYSICRYTEYTKQDEQGNIIDTKRIWYIHGYIDKINSITLGYDQYCGMLTNINRYIKGLYRKEGKVIPKIHERLKEEGNNLRIESWIDFFFVSDVYMIGYGLWYDEIDIWWLLNKRQRLIQDGRIKCENHISFYSKGNNEGNKFKSELLKLFGVTSPPEQPVNEYSEYYEKCMEDITNKINTGVK